MRLLLRVEHCDLDGFSWGPRLEGRLREEGTGPFHLVVLLGKALSGDSLILRMGLPLP